MKKSQTRSLLALYDGWVSRLYRDKIKGDLGKMFNNRNFGAGRRSFRDMDKIGKIFQNVKYVNTDNMPILKQISLSGYLSFNYSIYRRFNSPTGHLSSK